MPAPRRSGLPFKPDASFVLMMVLLVAAWLAGGASRADVMGQVVVRTVAWIALLGALLVSSRPSLGDARPVALILLGAALLVLLQLVPLPPGVWQALPGRSPLIEAAAASGQPQPWRPWSMVPGATTNAAASLIVPVLALTLLASMGERARLWLPGALLVLVGASTMVGMLQFSSAGLQNPLINDTPGQVSGSFANRNHFALFLAMGCLLAPVWAFLEDRRPKWRGGVAFGLVLLFALMILATGSRSGMVVGVLAICLGLLLVRRQLQRAFRRAPRWVLPAVVAAMVAIVLFFVLISLAADRAESINRALTIDTGEDMRARGLPTVWAMLWTYFPAGTGFGTFDPLFRMHEPFALLKITYFNHAHNDFLEVVLDGGAAALALLVAALGWWAVASWWAWRAGGGADHLLARTGSAMLLLLFIASIVDYPARTPMIMIMAVIAGVWLGRHKGDPSGSALPNRSQHV